MEQDWRSDLCGQRHWSTRSFLLLLVELLQDVLPLLDVLLIHVVLGEHLLLDIPTLSSSIHFLLVLCNLRDLVDSHPLTDAVNLAAGRGSICLNLGFLTSFLVPEYFLADQFLTSLMGNVADVDMMDRSKLRT